MQIQLFNIAMPYEELCLEDEVEGVVWLLHVDILKFINISAPIPEVGLC